MKSVLRLMILSLLISLVSTSISIGQEPNNKTSKWEGSLMAGQFELKIIFTIGEDQCSIDVPLQSIKDYKANKVETNGDSIFINFTGMFVAKYCGKIEAQTISGVWHQSGMEFPLNLKRYKAPGRPQNPQPPFPYDSQELTYHNKDKTIEFGATLTLPKEGKKHPVAILITGSGQQDRDETVFNHKPFLIISDYLTRNGIAVLRVDDRGVGATTGKETLKTSTSFDFAKDVEAGIEMLKKRADIDHNAIGLIGHSEGGMIATIIGSQRADIAFIVSMAGPGVKGSDVIFFQNELGYRRTFSSEVVDSALVFEKQAIDIVCKYPDSESALKELSDHFQNSDRLAKQDNQIKALFGYTKGTESKTFDANFIQKKYAKLASPWFLTFLNFAPSDFLSEVKAPFLAINGEKDTQVEPKMNLEGFRQAFKKCGKKNYHTIQYTSLNHFFQHCKTGQLEEIIDIEETISEEVLEDITQWIKKQL